MEVYRDAPDLVRALVIALHRAPSLATRAGTRVTTSPPSPRPTYPAPHKLVQVRDCVDLNIVQSVLDHWMDRDNSWPAHACGCTRC